MDFYPWAAVSEQEHPWPQLAGLARNLDSAPRWRGAGPASGVVDAAGSPTPHPPPRAGSQSACVPSLPLPLLLRLPELIDHEGDAIRQPHGSDAARGKARVSGHLPGCREGPTGPAPPLPCPAHKGAQTGRPEPGNRFPKAVVQDRALLEHASFLIRTPGPPPALTAACTALLPGARPGPCSA